jgi:hypothetical protein
VRVFEALFVDDLGCFAVRALQKFVGRNALLIIETVFDDLVNSFNGQMACNLAALMATHAVGNDVEPEVFVDEKMILIVFAPQTNVSEAGNLESHGSNGTEVTAKVHR